MTRALRMIFAALALAAVFSVIYFNIQTVPAGQVGLLYEKTLGWQKEVWPAGRHWLFSGFVPEKWQLHLVSLEPAADIVEFRQGLRYSSYLKLSEEFYFFMRLRLTTSLPAEEVLSLYSRYGDALPAYLRERLLLLLQVRFFDYLRSDSDLPALKSRFQLYLAGAGEGSLAHDWPLYVSPQVKLSKAEIMEIRVPDAALYQQQASAVPALVAAEQKKLLREIETESEISRLRRLDQAESEKLLKFSALLKDNPLLLDYLRLEKLNSRASVVIVEESLAGKGSVFSSVADLGKLPAEPQKPAETAK